jgi:NitT/TauT family transport system substrate-binding protein
MKHKTMIGLIILAFLLSGCGGENTDAIGDDLEVMHIRLPMGYIPSVQYAPFYVALEKGYFSEAGFEVEFDYSWETDGIALVGQGELPFALVSGEQVLLAREQDIPLVYVMSWFQDFPVAVVAKVESGISTPQDLVGKKVGMPVWFGANYIGLIAMLHAEGISEADLVLETIGYNQVEALATDQDDAVVVYSTNEPVQLRHQGYDIVTFEVSDYVELTANGVVTNEETIAENPDVVSRFVSAVIKGVEDTIADPEEAYEICFEYVENLEELDREVQMEVLNRSIEFWKADTVGYAQASAWENMQQVLLEMELLSDPLDLDAAYTNRFIE